MIEKAEICCTCCKERGTRVTIVLTFLWVACQGGKWARQRKKCLYPFEYLLGLAFLQLRSCHSLLSLQCTARSTTTTTTIKQSTLTFGFSPISRWKSQKKLGHIHSRTKAKMEVLKCWQWVVMRHVDYTYPHENCTLVRHKNKLKADRHDRLMMCMSPAELKLRTPGPRKHEQCCPFGPSRHHTLDGLTLHLP